MAEDIFQEKNFSAIFLFKRLSNIFLFYPQTVAWTPFFKKIYQ